MNATAALALALAILGLAAAASLPPVPALPTYQPSPIPESLK